MIRAALPIQGRAITIYEEVYPLSNHTSGKAHHHFLTHLAKVLPENVTPIICTDAGFKVPWCKEVDSDWANAKDLYQYGTNRPKELGTIQLSKAQK